jgi:hypothetical protein
MSEVTNEVVEIYAYVNDKGQKVYTPNVEFAQLMGNKYGSDVYVEKN